MGLAKKLKEMSKEYMQDPRGQYFRNLEKVLNLHRISKVSKDEVLKYVNDWYLSVISK